MYCFYWYFTPYCFKRSRISVSNSISLGVGTSKSDLSIYEIMQIPGISAFDKTHVKELLTEFQINQNVKEQRNLFNDLNF
jgi:hypothetical protein